LVAAGWQHNDKTPVDFNSVEQRYRHSCNPKDKQQGDDEDWRCWLAILQVSKGKTILGQEPVAAGWEHNDKTPIDFKAESPADVRGD
jgi:phage terminase large subunit-like protein